MIESLFVLVRVIRGSFFLTTDRRYESHELHETTRLAISHVANLNLINTLHVSHPKEDRHVLLILRLGTNS